MDLIEKLEKETANGLGSHAYLFVGGSRSEAERAIETIVRGKKCLPEDLIVIDTDILPIKPKKTDKKESNEIKAEMVREFIRQLSLSSYGDCRIGVIWWCERLNTVSANILLKTLEEPPKNVILILVSSTENVLATIKSRCRVMKLNVKASSQDHTFSYDELNKLNLASSFKKVEAIVKNDEVESFLTQMLQHFGNLMVETQDVKIEQYILEIFTAQKRIRGNANKRLVLENLILGAKKIDG